MKNKTETAWEASKVRNAKDTVVKLAHELAWTEPRDNRVTVDADTFRALMNALLKLEKLGEIE